MKKSFYILTSFCLLLLSFTSIHQNVVSAASVVEKNELQKMDPTQVKNLDDVLDTLDQKKDDIYSSFWLDKNVGSAVINIYNENEDKHYNLYVEKDTITYYSTQYYTDKSKEFANFELYTVYEDLSISHEFTSTISTQTGEVDFDFSPQSVDPNLYRWACIFSSYVACAAAAGTIGWVIGGPWGAAGAAFACRYVFQTLVERYGSKERACSILGA